MAEPHSFSVLFRPGMHPADRHAIEDELEEALGDAGEITGGGTAVDLSNCDISIDVADRYEGLRVIREVLQQLAVPNTTVIVEYEPQRAELPVYE